MHGEGGGGGGLVNHCIGREGDGGGGGGGGYYASPTPIVKTPLLGDIVTLKGGEPRSVNYRHANSGVRLLCTRM